jgi:hypothetical protein
MQESRFKDYLGQMLSGGRAAASIVKLFFSHTIDSIAKRVVCLSKTVKISDNNRDTSLLETTQHDL